MAEAAGEDGSNIPDNSESAGTLPASDAKSNSDGWGFGAFTFVPCERG